MKSYLVSCCYGDVICGVFDSREAAKAGLAECEEKDTWYGEYFITEFVTNSLESFFKGDNDDDVCVDL